MSERSITLRNPFAQRRAQREKPNRDYSKRIESENQTISRLLKVAHSIATHPAVDAYNIFGIKDKAPEDPIDHRELFDYALANHLFLAVTHPATYNIAKKERIKWDNAFEEVGGRFSGDIQSRLDRLRLSNGYLSTEVRALDSAAQKIVDLTLFTLGNFARGLVKDFLKDIKNSAHEDTTNRFEYPMILADIFGILRRQGQFRDAPEIPKELQTLKEDIEKHRESYEISEFGKIISV